MEHLSKEEITVKLENTFASTVIWLNEQPDTAFNEEIIPEKWTMAGHLYHLIKSTRAVNKGLEMPRLAMRTMFGKNNREERTYQETLTKYENVLDTGVKAPPNVSAKPGRIFDKAALIQRFEDELKQLKKHLEKWDEKKLSEYVLPHPAIGKMTIRELMYFTEFHTAHHLKTLRDNYVQTKT